jgi:hypothetical protein
MVTMPTNLYCKIYVNTHLTNSNFRRLIANILSGTVQRRTVYSKELIVDINKNEYFDDTMFSGNEDEFLFYQFYLDIQPSHPDDEKSYIAEVSRLLEELWRNAGKAVAACDFEDILPNKGGIALLNQRHPDL